MGDSIYTKLLLFQRSVYKQKLFLVTRLPNIINKNTKQYRKLKHKAWSIGALLLLLILLFDQFKKNTKSKGLHLLYLALQIPRC